MSQSQPPSPILLEGVGYTTISIMRHRLSTEKKNKDVKAQYVKTDQSVCRSIEDSTPLHPIAPRCLTFRFKGI
jgi:hypothetical protein